MIRRRGPVQLGVRHGRLRPVGIVALTILPVLIASAVGASVANVATSAVFMAASLSVTLGDFVRVDSTELTSTVKNARGQKVVVPVADIAAVAMLGRKGEVLVPAVLTNFGGYLPLTPLRAFRRFGGERSTKALTDEIARLVGADVISLLEFEQRATHVIETVPALRRKERRRTWRAGVALLAVASLVFSAALVVDWAVGRDKLPLIATEGSFDSPAAVELAEGNVHGIWTSEFLRTLEVIGPNGEPVEVEWIPVSEIYDRSPEGSPERIGRIKIATTGSYRFIVENYAPSEIDLTWVEPRSLRLGLELSPVEVNPKFRVGQDPLNPDKERFAYLLWLAGGLALTGLVLGAALVGTRADHSFV